MREYGLFVASALVSAITNTLGLLRRGPIRRLLVVKVDHLGDVVTATPALRVLRDAYPGARIDLLVAPPLAPLFAGGALVSRAIPYESPRFRRGRGQDPTAGTVPGHPEDARPRGESVLRAVASGRYDAVVELRGDWATLRVSVRTGARRRVDRGTVRLRDWFARRLGRGGRPPLHEVETNLAVVRPLLPRAARDTPPPPSAVNEGKDAGRSMRARFEALGLDFAQPVVCVHAGAAWRPKAWRADRFTAVARGIAGRYGAQVVFVGSGDERDIESALRAAWRGPRAWFAFGTLAIPELAALFRSARLVIGSDSGPAHLAAACGTPVIALFGPQDPRRFGPWSPLARVLHHRVDCFPCDQTVCVRPDLPCVNLIEVAEVEAAARELLGPAMTSPAPESRHPPAPGPPTEG